MSADSGLLVEQNEQQLTLTLNRPDASNSLTPELVEAMINALTGVYSIRLCVIKANGRNFCAGFDLSNIESLSDGDLLLRFVRLETLLQMIHHASYSVLILSQGHAVGAGADIVAAGGYRVAAPGATFRMPGWQFGLALGTRRLTQLVGTDAARDLLIDTKIADAESALSIGLINEVSDQSHWDAVIATAWQRASTLPEKSLNNLMGLTVNDSRSSDMAALAISAAEPGLKQRILDYSQRVKAARKSKK